MLLKSLATPSGNTLFSVVLLFRQHSLLDFYGKPRFDTLKMPTLECTNDLPCLESHNFNLAMEILPVSAHSNQEEHLIQSSRALKKSYSCIVVLCGGFKERGSDWSRQKRIETNGSERSWPCSLSVPRISLSVIYTCFITILSRAFPHHFIKKLCNWRKSVYNLGLLFKAVLYSRYFSHILYLCFCII